MLYVEEHPGRSSKKKLAKVEKNQQTKEKKLKAQNNLDAWENWTLNLKNNWTPNPKIKFTKQS